MSTVKYPFQKIYNVNPTQKKTLKQSHKNRRNDQSNHDDDSVEVETFVPSYAIDGSKLRHLKNNLHQNQSIRLQQYSDENSQLNDKINHQLSNFQLIRNLESTKRHQYVVAKSVLNEDRTLTSLNNNQLHISDSYNVYDNTTYDANDMLHTFLDDASFQSILLKASGQHTTTTTTTTTTSNIDSSNVRVSDTNYHPSMSTLSQKSHKLEEEKNRNSSSNKRNQSSKTPLDIDNNSIISDTSMTTISMNTYEIIQQKLYSRRYSTQLKIKQSMNTELYHIHTLCAIIIQKYIRRYLQQLHYKYILTTLAYSQLLDKNATQIQRVIRGYLCRCRYDQLCTSTHLYQIRSQNASIIQLYYRKYKRRMYTKWMHTLHCAIKIQKCYRGHLGRLAYQHEKSRLILLYKKHLAVLCIQKNWRIKIAYEELKHLKIHKHATVEIQKMYRGYRLRKQLYKQYIWDKTDPGMPRIQLSMKLLQEKELIFTYIQDEIYGLEKAEEKLKIRIMKIHQELQVYEKKLTIMIHEISQYTINTQNNSNNNNISKDINIHELIVNTSHSRRSSKTPSNTTTNTTTTVNNSNSNSNNISNTTSTLSSSSSSITTTTTSRRSHRKEIFNNPLNHLFLHTSATYVPAFSELHTSKHSDTLTTTTNPTTTTTTTTSNNSNNDSNNNANDNTSDNDKGNKLSMDRVKNRSIISRIQDKSVLNTYENTVKVQVRAVQRRVHQETLEKEYSVLLNTITTQKQLLLTLEQSYMDICTTKQRKQQEYKRVQLQLKEILDKQKDEFQIMKSKGIQLETITATTAQDAITQALKYQNYETRSKILFYDTEQTIRGQFMSMSLSHLKSTQLLKQLRDNDSNEKLN